MQLFDLLFMQKFAMNNHTSGIKEADTSFVDR
jgi:hypothetical protein